MLICPKCSSQADVGSKICRRCGAILEEVVEVEEFETSAEQNVETETTSDFTTIEPDDESNARERIDEFSAPDEVISREQESDAHEENSRFYGEDEDDIGPSWTCEPCGERNPATFDVCWKCGSDKGTEKQEGEETSNEPIVLDVVETPSLPPKEAGLCCPRCGSNKIIPNVRLVDQGEGSTGKTRVVVFGNPDALVFKDRLYSEVTADVCGECGRIELRATLAKELYRHYRQSLKNKQ